MLHFSVKETIPCFYRCFSSSYLQWIGWLVSNTLYWCWAVSQGLLVRFSSCCFIYLIRNCLLKKIMMTTHSPRLENYLQAIWNQHVDFKFSWGFPKWLLEHKCEVPCLRCCHQVVMPFGRHYLGWVLSTIWNSGSFGEPQDRHPKLLSFLEGKLIPVV